MTGPVLSRRSNEMRQVLRHWPELLNENKPPATLNSSIKGKWSCAIECISCALGYSDGSIGL